MGFSAEKMYEKCSEAEKEKISTRLCEIQAYLPAGYRIRDDSTLAYNYSVDQGNLKALDVASEIVFTEQLFTQTPYKTEVESRLKQAAEHLHNKHPSLPWKKIWPLARCLVPAIKLVAKDYN